MSYSREKQPILRGLNEIYLEPVPPLPRPAPPAPSPEIPPFRAPYSGPRPVIRPSPEPPSPPPPVEPMAEPTEPPVPAGVSKEANRIIRETVRQQLNRAIIVEYGQYSATELPKALEQALFASVSEWEKDAEIKKIADELLKIDLDLSVPAEGLNNFIADLADRTGLANEQIEWALQAQQHSIAEMAAQQEMAERKHVKKKIAGRIAGYIGGGIALKASLGLAFVAPVASAIGVGGVFGVRVLDNYLTEKKVGEKRKAIAKNINEAITNERDDTGYRADYQKNLFALLAMAKQEQIDELGSSQELKEARENYLRDPSNPDAQEILDQTIHLRAGSFGNRAYNYLESTYFTETDITDRDLMAGAVAGLYAVDQRNVTMQAELQQPARKTVLGKLFAKLEDNFTLLQGRTLGDKAITSAVFSAASIAAISTPILRNILCAYAGFKAGEFLAKIASGSLKRILATPMSVMDLRDRDLAEARWQLSDPKTSKRFTSAQRKELQEAVDYASSEWLKTYADNARGVIEKLNNDLEKETRRQSGYEKDDLIFKRVMQTALAAIGALIPELIASWHHAPSEHPEIPQAPSVAPPQPPASEAVEAVKLDLDKMSITDIKTRFTEWTHDHAEQFDSAIVHQDEGVTHSLVRQLEADPKAYGYTGDVNNHDALHHWAVLQSRQIAIDNNYIEVDKAGHITSEVRVSEADKVAYALVKGADGKLHVIEQQVVHDPASREFHVDTPKHGMQNFGLKGDARMSGTLDQPDEYHYVPPEGIRPEIQPIGAKAVPSVEEVAPAVTTVETPTAATGEEAAAPPEEAAPTATAAEVSYVSADGKVDVRYINNAADPDLKQAQKVAMNLYNPERERTATAEVLIGKMEGEGRYNALRVLRLYGAIGKHAQEHNLDINEGRLAKWMQEIVNGHFNNPITLDLERIGLGTSASVRVDTLPNNLDPVAHNNFVSQHFNNK